MGIRVFRFWGQFLLTKLGCKKKYFKNYPKPSNPCKKNFWEASTGVKVGVMLMVLCSTFNLNEIHPWLTEFEYCQFNYLRGWCTHEWVSESHPISIFGRAPIEFWKNAAAKIGNGICQKVMKFWERRTICHFIVVTPLRHALLIVRIVTLIFTNCSFFFALFW